MSLGGAGKCVVGRSKTRKGAKFEKYWKENKDFAIKYCIKEAKLARDAAKKYLEIMFKSDVLKRKIQQFVYKL